MAEENQSVFEKRIKPILNYVGLIGAVITSIMYIIVVVILIWGFEVHNIQQTLIFAVINAIIGLIIVYFLKVQGISFAKNLPENIKTTNEYYGTKIKNKKYHSIKYYTITSTIIDIVFKGLSIILTTTGVIYIVVQGSHDYNLLLLALANLLMFISFGIISLNKAYEFYNNFHVPYMKHEIELVKNKITKGDINKCLQSMEKNIETLKNK